MKGRRRGRVLLAWCAAFVGGCAVQTLPTVSPTVVSERGAGSVVLSVQDWSYAGRPGQIVRTEHYRIFTTATDRQLGRQIPAFLELALGQYTSALADLPKPPMKLDTFVLDSRWQWSRMTKQLMGERAELYLRIGRGGYAAQGRAVLYDIGPRDTLSIAAHEGWHQFTQLTFRSRLPVWMEEGVATYMEGFRTDPGDPAGKRMLPWANVERFDQLRSAHARGRTLPLGELLVAAPESLIEVTTQGTLTYYAQVWALTHFLREGAQGRYREGLRRLLIDAAEGRVARAVRARLGPESVRRIAAEDGPRLVFLAYFNEDLAEAEREFEEFMSHVVRTGARDLIVQGESPVGAEIDRGQGS